MKNVTTRRLGGFWEPSFKALSNKESHPELVSGSTSWAVSRLGCSSTIARGFTLIELLVVVFIIGILAAIALPQYEVAVRKSRVARVLPVLKSIVNAKQVYYMANGQYTADLDTLDIDFPYTSRTERDQTIIYNTPVGDLHNPNSGPAVFWQGPGFSIDFYPTYQLCYPSQAEAGKTGEKVCASLGEKTGQLSAWGDNVYRLR